MNDAIRESMAETNDLISGWARQMAAEWHARREVAIIAVLARHSWAWEVLGVNQWCEQRRSSS
jgi:hypothetical protein